MSKKANAPAGTAEADAVRDNVRTASLALNDIIRRALRQVGIRKAGPEKTLPASSSQLPAAPS